MIKMIKLKGIVDHLAVVPQMQELGAMEVRDIM
jgi:hypothetical protein